MYHLRLTLSAVVGRMSETRSYWRRRRAHSASSRPCDETKISRCGLRLISFPIISSKGIKHHKVPFFGLQLKMRKEKQRRDGDGAQQQQEVTYPDWSIPLGFWSMVCGWGCGWLFDHGFLCFFFYWHHCILGFLEPCTLLCGPFISPTDLQNVFNYIILYKNKLKL